MEDNLDKMIKEIPLETRISVPIKMEIIGLLTDLGFMNGTMWDKENEVLIATITESSKALTKELIKEFKKWESDGKP